jgi:hypothetical protein
VFASIAGNLKQWWKNGTVEKFRTRAQCIIDQYSSFVLEEVGMNINGKMTQGLRATSCLTVRVLILNLHFERKQVKTSPTTED